MVLRCFNCMNVRAFCIAFCHYFLSFLQALFLLFLLFFLLHLLFRRHLWFTGAQGNNASG